MLKVLLVGDEPYMSEEFKTMMDREKLEITICGEAANGKEALDLLSETVCCLNINIDELIKRILEGDIDGFLFKQVKSFLSIDDKQEIKCILIEIDHFKEWLNEQEDRKAGCALNLIKRVITQSLPNKAGWHLLAVSEKKICIILTDQTVIDHNMDKYISKLRKALREYCKCSVSVSISDKILGLEALKTGYEQAELAMKHRFYRNEGSIIYFSEIKKTPLNYSLCTLFLEPLLKNIQENEQAGITSKIDRLFRRFVQNMSAPEVVKVYIQNLELEVTKLVLALTKDEEKIATKFAQFEEGFDYESIWRLKEEVTDFCRSFAKYICSMGESNSRDIIQEIKFFVKENFNQDLNIQKVARHFYFNPVYLGQLFKENTGMRFSDYLHQIRINEAKRLLRRTNMKVAQIAREIGYRDPDYFTIKFKSIVQVTPSAFKNNL